MQPLYLACFNRDNWKCRHCGNRNGIHPHHVIFRSHQGEDVINNLITLCNCCHLEGIHGGRLELTVLDRTNNDVIVSFRRVNGWKPS